MDIIVICLCGMVLCDDNMTYQCIIGFIIIIICAMCSKGIQNVLFDHAIFQKCEKLSLAIYVSQALIINIVHQITEKNIILERHATVIYLIFLMIYSIVFERIVGKIQKGISKRQRSTL